MKVMPISKKRTALEEAEWEDVEGDGTLARELMLQCASGRLIFPVSLLLTRRMPFSDGDATGLPTEGRPAWSSRYGATVCRNCYASSS